MEVLLLVAVLVLGASVLYVAVTLNSRTRQATNPGIQLAQQDITSKLESVDKSLRDQLQAIDHTLASSYALTEQMQRRLARAGTQISELSSQLAAERDDVKRLGDYVARLNESVAQQSTRLSAIENYLGSKRGLATADISQLQESLNDLGERQSRTHAELVEFAGALKRLIPASGQRDDYDRQAAEQMLDAAGMVLRGQRDIENYLRSRLDYEVVRTSGDHEGRIVTAGLYLDQPGADLLWPLCLEFCETMKLKPLLPERPRPASCGSYLLWQPSDDQRLEEVLAAKLTACPDNQAQPSPGLEELRAVALVLHRAGPGTVQLGPMIINRTPRALLGCVLTAAETAQVTSTDTLTSADACEARLRELGHDRIVDLTSWADAVARQTLDTEETEAPGQPG